MSYQNGIIHNLIRNRLEIFFPGDETEAVITEENIVSESMTLKQRICDSETLRFGGCIASELTIQLTNTAQRQFSSALTGKWISVKLTQYYADPDAPVYPSPSRYPSAALYPGKTVDSRAFWIFSGYIDSAKVDKKDKNVFTVTAYDALAKLYGEDATDDLFQRFKMAGYILEQILSMCTDSRGIARSGTLNYLNETYTVDGSTYRVGAYNVKNDYWLNRKDTVSYGMLLKYVCEILGAFGVIVPDEGKGKFTFRRLSGTAETYGFYEELMTGDCQSTGYTDFRFDVSGDKRTGKSVTAIGGLSDAADGAVDKIYDFSGNILVLEPYAASGSSRTSTPFDYLINRTSIGTRLAMNAESTAHSGQATWSRFQPLVATLDGRLWVTPGMPIEILVNRTTVDGDYVYDENGNIIKDSVKTYVLSRTLTGIQALTDTIEVKGAP